MDVPQQGCPWIILGIIVLAIKSSTTDALLTCDSVFYIDIGEKVEISCQYPLSFLSVRWYRGEDTTPIAFIDDGTKHLTGGYDITVSGGLIINDVSLQDEGNYTISVLDRFGGNERNTVNVYVRVALTNRPFMENCLSSTNALCSSIDEIYRANTLVCTTQGTRPAAILEWYTIEREKFKVINKTASEIERDVTSMMYSSSSILSYDPDTFALQSFTCRATGKAVKVPLDTTTMVEGLQRPSFINQNSISVELNSYYDLICSESFFQIGQWKIIYSNGTSLVLADMYPGHFSSHCTGGERCSVQEDGSLTINGIEVSDEATYECLFSNGYEAGMNIAHISVKVTPNPMEILIDGCTESKECTIDVIKSGVLKASVFGARPPVVTLCYETDRTGSDKTLSNEQSQVEGDGSNTTFTTIYTVEYDIPKCSGPVHVVCKVSPNSFHGGLSPVDIYLVTDSDGCVESGGSVILLIVIVVSLLVLVATVTVVIFLKRNQGFPFGPIKEEHHTEDETIPLTEKANSVRLLQDLCENQKKVPKEELQELLKHGDDINKFSVDDFMVFLSNNLKEEKISELTFVHITGQLFITNQLSQEKLLTSVYTLLQTNVLTREALTHMILQYSMLYKMDIKIVSKEEENKEGLVMVTYPYYLQEIHALLKKGQHDFKLYQRFEDVLKKKIGKKGLSIFTKNKSDDEEENPYEDVSKPKIKEESRQGVENQERDNEEEENQEESKNVSQENPHQSLTQSPEEEGGQEEEGQHSDQQDNLYQFVIGSPKEKGDEQGNIEDKKSHHYEVINELKAEPKEQAEDQRDIYEDEYEDEDEDDDTKNEEGDLDERSFGGIQVQPDLFIQWQSECVKTEVMPKECFEQRVAENIQGKEVFWFHFILTLRNTQLNETILDEDLGARIFNIVVKQTTVKLKKVKKLINGMNVSKNDKKFLLAYLKS